MCFLWNVTSKTFQCQPKYRQGNLNEDQHFPLALTPVAEPRLCLNHSCVIPAEAHGYRLKHSNNTSMLRNTNLNQMTHVNWDSVWRILFCYANNVRKYVNLRRNEYLLCLGNYYIWTGFILQRCFYSFQCIETCINPMILEKSTTNTSMAL